MTPPPPVRALRDLYWRSEPWVSGGIVLAGAASPLWGPVIARTLRLPWRLAIALTLSPIGSLLLAGYTHDLLRRRTPFKPATSTRLEVLVTCSSLLLTLFLPLLRYRRQEGPG